jgi:serine/threonine-protein kinase
LQRPSRQDPLDAADRPWVSLLADRYRVERELGRGGMAVVFLARDLKHDRDVALKVLRPELSAALGRDRFTREIQLTARLQHPHILPVFDSGETAGQLWYVMPYVEGETLRVRIARDGRLPVDAAIQLAREVASALAYAHDAGVVHRDIKPENILLSRQGQALVADFGIAKALSSDEALTETGLALGTPAYMPPEQVLGERPVRPQADVYALGVVLYEMLAGVRPFADSAPTAMLAKRLTDGAPLVTAQRPEVPEAIALLVRDTLEVDPARRPASGAALAGRLQTAGVSTPVPTVHLKPARVRPARTWVFAAASLAVVTAGAFMLSRLGKDDQASIGVLPFENRSGDSAQAYLSEGVTDELTAQLSAVPDMRVSPRSSTIRFRGSRETPETIARKLGVRYLLTGGISRQGDSVRMSVELIDAPGKRQRWSRVHVGPARSLAGFVDTVAREVTRSVAPSASGATGRASPTTQDSLAYTYYLLSQHHWNRFTEPDLRRALAYSDSAIARDPAYANAWLARANALVALASGIGSITGREAVGPLRQALDTILVLDPMSGRAHAIRGIMYTWFEVDWDAADREFRQAFALEPTAATNYQRAAFLQAARGNTDSALALSAVMQRLEPANIRGYAAQFWYYGRRYERSLATARRALQLDPGFFGALQYEALSLSMLGRHTEAIASARRASTNPAPVFASTLAIVLAQADSLDAAREIIDTLEARVNRKPFGAVIMFRAYAALGDADRMFAWLDRAIAERSPGVAYLHVDPLLDPYRADPRFKAAIARAGLPPP